MEKIMKSEGGKNEFGGCISCGQIQWQNYMQTANSELCHLIIESKLDKLHRTFEGMGINCPVRKNNKCHWYSWGQDTLELKLLMVRICRRARLSLGCICKVPFKCETQHLFSWEEKESQQLAHLISLAGYWMCQFFVLCILLLNLWVCECQGCLLRSHKNVRKEKSDKLSWKKSDSTLITIYLFRSWQSCVWVCVSFYFGRSLGTRDEKGKQKNS